MELDWLETFLAVVETGGFTSASAQVHRSQSRVSAHIAALEKDLGVRLIDRARRPATVTAAGRLLAVHAASVLTEISSARSAIGVLREMQSGILSVLTTAGLGPALFPGVLTEMVTLHPEVSVALSERGYRDSGPADLADGFAMAVLPTLPLPHGPGLRERLIFRDPFRVVVPPDHELAVLGGSVEVCRLARYPLVVTGAAGPEPEVPALLRARGLAVRPLATVEDPGTLVGMVRRGLGIGVERAVALDDADIGELVVLDIDDPEMVSDVAVYWYDALLTTDIGRTLYRAVVDAPLPGGALPVGTPPPGPSASAPPSRMGGGRIAAGAR